MFDDDAMLRITAAKSRVVTDINYMNIISKSPSAIGSHNVIIAGGYFSAILQAVGYKDIDVFILKNDHALFDRLVSVQTITSTRKGSQLNYMRNDRIKSIADTANNIQYILTDFINREELIAHFDFAHCCVSYDVSMGSLHLSPYTYDCIKNMKLRANGNNVPASWRIDKFIKRGWDYKATAELGSSSRPPWSLHTNQSQNGEAPSEGLVESYEKTVQKAVSDMLYGTNMTNVIVDDIVDDSMEAFKKLMKD